MSENTAQTKRAPRVPTAYREDAEKREALEQIGTKKGHAELSDTLREATADYIARHLHLLKRSA